MVLHLDSRGVFATGSPAPSEHATRTHRDQNGSTRMVTKGHATRTHRDQNGSTRMVTKGHATRTHHNQHGSTRMVTKGHATRTHRNQNGSTRMVTKGHATRPHRNQNGFSPLSPRWTSSSSSDLIHAPICFVWAKYTDLASLSWVRFRPRWTSSSSLRWVAASSLSSGPLPATPLTTQGNHTLMFLD